MAKLGGITRKGEFVEISNTSNRKSYFDSLETFEPATKEVVIVLNNDTEKIWVRISQIQVLNRERNFISFKGLQVSSESPVGSGKINYESYHIEGSVQF